MDSDRKVQPQWGAMSSGTMSIYPPKNARISRRIRTLPAYSILFYFYMIPRVNLTHNIPSRFHHTSLLRMVIAFSTLLFLFLVLLHDTIYFCMNKEFWGKYFKNGNRIITLLLSIRYILIFWKNVASVFLFLFKSKHLHRYLVELNAMVVQVPMTKKTEKRHRVMFLLVYIGPFVLMGFRVALSVWMLATETRPDRMVRLGFINAPLWAKLSFYHFAEIIGGVICIAVYVQIAAFVFLLKCGCRHLNTRLVALNFRLKEDKEMSSQAFQKEVRSLRDFHELLIDLCNKHEDLFSLQILVAVLDNAFVVFSSLASFFAPGVTIEAVAVYLISIVAFIYAILLQPVFHIQLSEESNKTIELFQDVVHKRSQAASSDCRPIDEFILLTYFLQRAMTKPLVITAGGFMELTRSFVISIGAVITGFILFLMERVESQQAVTGATTLSSYNLSIMSDWTTPRPLPSELAVEIGA